MVKRGLALCFSLMCSSAAMGGAEIVLVCDTGPDCTQLPGGTINVEVFLRQTPAAEARLLRLAQFDFSQTDDALVLNLPAQHPAPNGREGSSADIGFWDYSSTPTCAANSADCGFGHFVDDELAGSLPPGEGVLASTYLGDLDTGDLNPNVNNQWVLPGDGTEKLIGSFQLVCPDSLRRQLDVANATEADPAFGARIDFGFDTRTTWRAHTGEITGGTAMVCGDIPDECVLASSVPACDSTVPGSGGNIIDLEFDAECSGLTAPAPGEIVIQRLADGGGFTGGDLSGSFTYSVESGNVLRIQEDGTVFEDRAWYAIMNTGDWAGVANFKVDLEVAIGDANEDGFVLASDVLLVNASVGCFSDCDPRLDINGDSFILASDVLAANARVGNFGTPKNTGHTCGP